MCTLMCYDIRCDVMSLNACVITNKLDWVTCMVIKCFTILLCYYIVVEGYTDAER